MNNYENNTFQFNESSSKFATLAMVVILVPFLTNWATYQHLLHQGVAPLFFYFLAIALAAFVAIIRPSSISLLIRDPLFIWFLSYAITGTIWALASGDVDSENREWRIRWLILFLFSSGLIISYSANLSFIAKVMVASIALATITFWHDILNPFSYVPAGMPYSNPGRGAGFFINANQAGNALLVMGISTVPFINPRWRGIVILAVMIGVLATLSRSSILFLMIVVVVWAWHGRIGGWNMLIMIAIGSIFTLLGTQLFDAVSGSAEFDIRNLMGRIDFFINPGETNDASAQERQYLAALGWEKFVSHPWMGMGVGSTDSLNGQWGYGQSTHNMILRLMVEQGIFGALLYITFLILLFMTAWRAFSNKRLYKKGDIVSKDIGIASFLMVGYFVFIGLFSHTLFQDPFTILPLALLTSASQRLCPRA